MADTKLKVIDGMEFQVRAPYAEGHTLNAAEAKTLNQVRAENIGNNLRSFIKEAKAEGKSAEEITAAVEAYDAEYEFSLAVGSTARKLDPVEREAIKIAKEIIKAHLAKTGRKLTVAPEGMTKEEWEDKVAEQVETLAARDEVLKEAKKAVAAQQKRAESLIAGMSL